MKPMVFKKSRRQKRPAVELLSETEPSRERKETGCKGKRTDSCSGAKGFTSDSTGCLEEIRQSAGAKEVDGWRLPPIDILDDISEKEIGQADNIQRARKIEEALKSYGVS